jgi:hypothetical protein
VTTNLKVLGKILSVAIKNHFRMPPYFTLVLRSLASLEGKLMNAIFYSSRLYISVLPVGSHHMLPFQCIVLLSFETYY